MGERPTAERLAEIRANVSTGYKMTGEMTSDLWCVELLAEIDALMAQVEALCSALLAVERSMAYLFERDGPDTKCEGSQAYQLARHVLAATVPGD